MTLDFALSGEEEGKELVIDKKIDEKKIESLAKAEVESLLKDVGKNELYKVMGEEEKKTFRNLLTSFKKDRLFVQANQILAKLSIDDYHARYYGKDKEERKKRKIKTLDEVLENKDSKGNVKDAAKKKSFGGYMSAIAIAGILALGALLAMSMVCASAGAFFCGTEHQPELNPDGTQRMVGGVRQTIQVPGNVPLQILESQFMLALIGGVIAPIVVRVLKEKYDINIEEGQIAMIMTDAVRAVKLYQNEANRLRNKDGKIPAKYQEKLRDLAFDSIKSSYDLNKYKSLIASVGAQVFDKAIDEAVKKNWLETYPLEKKQVEELISQSIDALPQIVEWKDLDEEVKVAFIDGHVRRLLSTLKIEGWALEQLTGMFDAEVSRRLVAAALINSNEALAAIKSDNEYLKYTSAALSAVEKSFGR